LSIVRSAVRSPVRSPVRSVLGDDVFGPASLFSSGAQGAWYDPSDYSTLFQDSAGTTPVTAVEQPVRLMRDRSGRGNHATAPNDASRPVLRARYNLLTFSEQFDNADWTKSSVTVTANTDTAPDGTLTADTLAATGANGTTLGSLVLVGGSYTFSVWLRRKTGTGDVEISAHSSGTWVTQTITSSWARYTVTQTLTVGTRTPGVRIVTSGDEVYAWGAQLLTAADQTSTGGAYQRIAAATSYDTSNPVWRPYLAFDGSDDSFGTSSIDFSGTDKMTVFAGVTKNTDTSFPVIVELGNRATIVNGSFTVHSSSSSTPRYLIALCGTSITAFEPATYTAPITNVIAASLDIAGAARVDEVVPRINGVLNQTNPEESSTAGTGNFGNLPLFIGRRNNASLPFNGRIYGLTVLGRATTAAEISAMEAWVAGKTGVTL